MTIRNLTQQKLKEPFLFNSGLDLHLFCIVSDLLVYLPTPHDSELLLVFDVFLVSFLVLIIFINLRLPSFLKLLGNVQHLPLLIMKGSVKNKF